MISACSVGSTQLKSKEDDSLLFGTKLMYYIHLFMFFDFTNLLFSFY